MHKPTALLLTTLLTAATCAPTSANPALKAIRDSFHNCHSATLTKIPATTTNYPWAEDCKALAAKLDPASSVTLGSDLRDRWFTFYGTCAFALSIDADSNVPPQYTVGNGDVIDLISTATAGLGISQRVGAQGGNDVWGGGTRG